MSKDRRKVQRIHSSVSDTSSIPTSIDHLAEFNGNCYELKHDICMNGYNITASKFYATSDERLKENISLISHNEMDKADFVDLISFNFKDDENKTKTYGVRAQNVQYAGLDEIIHEDENGNLNVDYISLLILKVASLEEKVLRLTEELNELKEKK